MTEIGRSLFSARVTVPQDERALVFVDGRFHDIFAAGRHQMAAWRRKVDVQAFSLNTPEFTSTYERALFNERPDLAKAHFFEVRTGPDEMAVILRNGKAYGVQGRDGRTVFWIDAGPWEVEFVDVSQTLEVPVPLARRLPATVTSKLKRFNVEQGQTGLLFVENALERELAPGAYAFWDAGRAISVRLIDLRWQALDVTGQEILTRDKVSIRVNLSAVYRVSDAQKAVSEVHDFGEALYRALQLAFRKSLGSKTLDQILENKVEADAEAAASVREEMARAGVEVGEITVKDIILPGEMRDILNKVVQAEKEAEANVIRRREETAATRSLLNTARVMEENPVMLRLKELEALEKISDKVQNLVVHSGTQGLLEDVVSLRSPAAKPAPRKG